MASEEGPREGRSVQVRLIGADDWATYREVRLAALADTPEAFSSSLERERAFGEQTWRDRIAAAATFLAFLDDAPAGTVTVLGYEQNHNHGFTGAAHIVAMWVSPPARKRGIGRRLVSAALDQARSAGAPSAVLWVFEDNERAYGLYERMGFRATEFRDSPPGRPDDVEVLMVADLR
ncbi:MAG TPA: GNAT family N-acetyltransferase [Streptosporangiaceae bacterium]|nr:GNAT family N-acetyltransferase [Streptosporangiaceae bacterium]